MSCTMMITFASRSPFTFAFGIVKRSGTQVKELSQEQVYGLSANEIASNASNPATPVTPFVHNRPLYSHVLFHFQHKSANETIFKEVKEYEQIFDDLDAEYERCVLDNKNLTIEKKNLLIKNDCLIAECLEKDICSIVLTSDIVVPPSSNCLCEDLRSACDREHTKVLELEAEVLKQQKMVIESEKRNSYLQQNHIDLQLKFQNYKQCIDTSSASNAIFEINKLRVRDPLHGKDTIQEFSMLRIYLMMVLNDSVRMALKGRVKIKKNVSLQRRYDELSKANTHSRTAYTEKLRALTSENTKLKALVHGKTSSGPSTSEKPKVLASGMYTNSSKYVPLPKRANWVKPTPLPKKKHVTFQEPPRTSNRPTQKPPVQQNKKPNVLVNLSTRTKPATESRKPMPKSHTRNHRFLPSKSVNARSAADHNRKLNFVDHNQFVIRSLKKRIFKKRSKKKAKDKQIQARSGKGKVMAISVISVSSDSSKDSVGTPAGRVILFGTIPTTILDTTPFVIPPTTHIDTTPIPTISPTIPSSPDYTPASHDYSPAFDMEFDPSEDPSSDHIPPLPATSPFLSSTDDSSDSDIPDTPPSPTHGIPFTSTLST
ncbi:hypothetical protein Tco_0005474 [Tanacetum coccineum]